MGLDEKAEKLAGRGKEAVGAATDNDSLEAEGEAQQKKAGLKEKVENVSDKAKDKIDDVL